MMISELELWQEAKELILSQFKDSEKLCGMIEIFISILQSLEKAAIALQHLLDIRNASGERLDFIASILRIERNIGESDEDFLERIIFIAGSRNAATGNNIIVNAEFLSGDSSPQMLEDADCTFIVYTPQGKQLARDKVKKLAGAGILGLPGAAITIADGSFLGTTDGKRILAVANDGDIEDMDYMEVQILVFAKEGV